MKFFIGILTAVLFAGTLILSFENNCSLPQIVFGFVVYLIPIILFSEIKSNSRIFVALAFSILFVYLNLKWEYYSTFVGVILAFILGFPIHYFRVRNTKIN
jgi:hypothetical protein